MITKVQVTQQDIDDSKGDECMMCPIDRAVTRLVKEGIEVATGQYSVSYYDHNGTTEFVGRTPLPEEAKRFVRAFDYQGNAQPVEFELEIPDSLLR